MNAAVAGLTTQSKPRLQGLLSILLIIVLGASLAKLMWLVLTPKQTLDLQVQKASQTNSVAKQKVNYGKIIANQHLFGQVKKVVAPPKTRPTQAPVKTVAPVKLNLKLHGIVAYQSRDGFALISSNNGRQKVYAKGDELEKNVTVLKIFPEKVVLLNNGQEEELLLPVSKIKGKKKSAGSEKPKGPGMNRGRLPANIPPPVSKNAPADSPPDLANFREQVMANPRKLMDVATPSPAMINGQFIGFRIQPGRERKLFRQLGFRPGDIITEVNGIVLDDASKGAQVLGELAQATEVSVKIKRGDQEIFIQHGF